jgi:hypothetical protein
VQGGSGAVRRWHSGLGTGKGTPWVLSQWGPCGRERGREVPLAAAAVEQGGRGVGPLVGR